LLVKEWLSGSAADDVVVDTELPGNALADTGGEDGARDVQLAALGAAIPGAVDDGVEGAEEGGEVFRGRGDQIAAEEGDSQGFECGDVGGFGAGGVGDGGGTEQDGEVDGIGLGWGGVLTWEGRARRRRGRGSSGRLW
jgi:hypothetical protein